MPPQRHPCLPPCNRSFETARALRSHYNNRPECAERWLEHFNFASSRQLAATTQRISNFNLSHSFHTTSPQPTIHDSQPSFDGPISFSIRKQLDQNPVGTSRTITSDMSNDYNIDKEVVDVFPRAGEITKTVKSPFLSLWEQLKQNGQVNLYHPFKNVKEWELAVWLEQSGLSISGVDSFLKLESVRTPQYHPPGLY